ncbi:MAG: hypothetical protein Q8N06_03790 [Hydrogenophaga sp.]|nr:hypothetical protein [Hydrogenophaga sp.]
MRAKVRLVGLVEPLALVGMLVKKQMSATRTAVPALQTAPGAAAPASAPTGSVRDQSQQVQQQVKQQVDALMQQARPMPDEGK